METTYKSLTKIIKSHSNILIMSHRNIDLDGFGSSLACSYIINSLKKKSSIVMNKKQLNPTVKKALELIKEENFNIVSKSNIEPNEYDLLIILDTCKKELVEDQTLIEKIKDVVVIDHHLVTNKNIIDTKMSYVNTNLSSINEFMVGYIKYLNKKISDNLATIMIAGIEIDTNFYRVKTTASTFIASASLLLMGASFVEKHNLLKEDKEEYLSRMKLIEKSYMVGNSSICVIDDIIEKEELSMISERMLMFEGVTSAFTIGYTYDKIVAISARSLGGTDVFEIMQKFGGGGHMTEAAAQIEDKEISEVKKELENILR